MKIMFNVGDQVKIIPESFYVNNKEVPSNIINTKLYIRQVTEKGYLVGKMMNGPALGEISSKYLKNFQENDIAIDPYIIKTLEKTPLYQSYSKNSGVINRLDPNLLITIVNEKNGFGKIKMGNGWLELAKVEVM